jgi:hypothetical protein
MTLNYGDWADREDHESAFDAMTHRSSGYLFSDTDQGVILAQSVYKGEPGDRAAGALLIPRGSIIAIRTLTPE